MKCLRCGYCCIFPSVAIIDDDNPAGASCKESGVRCKHLSFDGDEASCAIHNEPRYIGTPCFEHDQVGAPDAPCRIGQGVGDGIVDIGKLEKTYERMRNEQDKELGSA